MRVLQLIDSLDTGGAEKMAVGIANATASIGVDSHLCATVRSGPLESLISESVSKIILGKKRKIDMPAFKKFFNYVKKNKIEIIHAHSTSIQLAVLTKMRFSKVKIVWHDHYGMSEKLQKRPKAKLKTIAPFIDTVIAVNEPLQKWSIETLGIKNTLFLNNFLQESANELEHTHLKGIDGKRVICLANLRPQKNHIQLIKAFGKSIESHSEWTLHLVGKDFHDAYSSRVSKEIENAGLSEQIFLYGARLDIHSILNQAEIGVLVSISEGLPLTLLEYGNASLPVITTDVGQCSEVIGKNGIVINNVEKELPDALILLYENKDKREELGSSFRESVLNTYSKDAFMDTLIPIYNSMLDS